MRDFSDFIDHLNKQDFRPPMVIDVGVAWGTPDLYHGFKESYFVLIEALDHFEEGIKRLLSKMNGEYYIYGVGDQNENITISVSLDSKALAGANILDKPRQEGQSFDVEIRKLDEIVQPERVPPGSLLKLDVQGGDLRALKGAARVLSKCDVVIAEASLFNKKNLVREIVNYMHDNEFELYDIFGALNRPYDNALGQVDLAFVKAGHNLLKFRGWNKSQKI